MSEIVGLSRINYLLIFLLALLGPRTAAMAHGVAATYQRAMAIELQAKFEGGRPMAGAQVTVYAPDNPAEPWLQGETDASGRFFFAPDAARAGDWQVRVRQSGHGTILSIPVGGQETTASLPATGQSVGEQYTLLQKLMMGGLGVWGAIGTALYFSRNPRKER